MSIVIYASWRGCEPIWEQGRHTGQLICKSVAYLWMCMCECVCVSMWMFVPINLCVWIEVSIGNRLIITVTPSFIIFIELFPVSALGVCKSLSVCVCVYLCVYPKSSECWLLLPTSALTLLFAAGSHPAFWPLLLFPGKVGEKPLENALPSEMLSVNGVPMVTSVLFTDSWLKIK